MIAASKPERAAGVIAAPRGSALVCRNWPIEAAYRMLPNNLDPEVAERPGDLIVYGGIGRAARNRECFERICVALKALAPNESLLIQFGKPVGVFETHENAPRVLIANSNLVPHWATWECFNELDQRGLMMYGQMTAGSWIYIGSQRIIQGTFETFTEMARQHFGGDVRGRWILTAGLGGMGGAQPLAATMAGFSMIAVECDEARIDFRMRTGHVDRKATSIEEAVSIIQAARDGSAPVSVGLLGNAAEVLPKLMAMKIRPDIVTDQTSAHDPVNGYLPLGWAVAEWRDKARTNPQLVANSAGPRRSARRSDVAAGVRNRGSAHYRLQRVPRAG